MPSVISSTFLLRTLAALSLLTACMPAPVPGIVQTGAPANPAIKVGKAPHGMAAAAGFVYNSNSGENTISVIEAATDKLATTLTLPQGHPSYIKASHDEKFLFVLSDVGKLYIYAPGQNQALLQTLDVGKQPDKLQISPDDHKVWVSLAGEDDITELDFTQGFAQAPKQRKLSTGKANPASEHRALALGLSWLATPNPADNDLSLVNPANGEQLRVRAGNEPEAVALGSWDGQDRMLIIGNKASNTVTLYHLEAKIAITLQDVGQTPTDIAVVPELTRAFVSMAGSNELTVIDYRQQKVLKRIPVGKRPVHVYSTSSRLKIQHGGHDHAEIWVCNDGGETVSVLDAEELTLKATVPVGKGHHKLAFWSQKAFVSNLSDGTLSVIDRTRLGLQP